MSTHYPRIRVSTRYGQPIREGLSLCFYLRPPHAEVASSVIRALDAYLHAVVPRALDSYADAEGEAQQLDDAGWAHVRQELLGRKWPIVHLAGDSSGYGFKYFGRPVEHPTFGPQPEAVRAVQFWLSTEYLEEHGPGRVRELALELSSLLPFASGHAGLAFDTEFDIAGVDRDVAKWCFRYPGLDIIELDDISMKLGDRVRGPAWLTFLGPPVLGELGGATGLRARLHSPGTIVQTLDAERAVVTLGPWPEAGDTEQGNNLPAYRELARVLEPWLFLRPRPEPSSTYTSERWERRFLDG